MGKGKRLQSKNSARSKDAVVRGLLTGGPAAVRPHIRQRLRLAFLFDGATNPFYVSWNYIHNTVLVATSAIAGVNLFDQCRLLGVEITAVPPVGSYGTVKLAWTGTAVGSTGDANFISSTSDGMLPAHVKARPPKGSTCSLWQPGNSTAVAFSLSSQLAPATAMLAMVYIDVEFSVNEDLGPLACTNALVGATAGQIYYRGLDAQPVASTAFYPQGVLYII
jgi:hypothetical protein